MSNVDRAEQVVAELAAQGVGEMVICAGSRNSPLVVTLAAATGFRCWHHFEERAAAFFALGRTRMLRKPVAVVTTSGTAVAELLPAAIEAHYTGSPLIFLTADRPAAYRGTGAPQVIEQVGLFGPFAHFSCDVSETDRLSLRDWDRTGPAHVNITFAEPLIDREPRERNYQAAEDPPPRRYAVHSNVGEPLRESLEHDATAARAEGRADRLAEFFQNIKRPLVIVGQLDPEDVPAVRDFLVRLRAPVYAEAHSGLREDEALQSLLLVSGGGAMRHGRCDGIVRLGGVPTARFWRDLDGKWAALPVCSLSRLPFSGLARKHTLIVGELKKLVAAVSLPARRESFAELFAWDAAFAHRLDDLLLEHPRAETALFFALSQLIPRGAQVYLGNSLPIREWDLAADRRDRGFTVGGNRGANGIDGQLSTFLGMGDPQRENWAVVGDLTALYDLASLWIAPELGAMPIRIVVVNNSGGKIFARLYDNPVFQNRHQLAFADWARMWGFAYERWERVPERVNASPRFIAELLPDEAATRRFWDAFDDLGK